MKLTYRATLVEFTYPESGFWWRVWIAVYFVCAGSLHFVKGGTIHLTGAELVASETSAAQPPSSLSAVPNPQSEIKS